MNAPKYAVLLSALVCADARGAVVVVDSNVSLYSPGIFSEFGLEVFQDAEGTEPTAVFFDRDGQFLIALGVNIDEGSDWYLANFGDRFDMPAIESSDFVTFFRVADETHNVIDVGFGEFYLGVNTGTFSPQEETLRNIFGWARFRNSPSGLELLGSAVAYGSDGIFIGTTRIIPEPCTLVLIAVCAACLLWRRM